MRDRRVRQPLAILVALAAILVLPGSAGAAITATSSDGDNTLIITTNDDTGEDIELKLSGAGNYLVNDAEVSPPLRAANDIVITIDGGAGPDRLRVFALDGTYASLTVHGRGGDDDLFMGTTESVERAFGDEGDDTFTSIEGELDAFGGNGDDVFTVRPGHSGGVGIVSGDAGADTIAYKLESDIEMAIRPGAVLGHVGVHVNFPGSQAPSFFDSDASAVEKVVIDGGVLSDAITASDGLAPLLTAGVEFNGNGGDDTFAGSDEGDTIFGGVGADTLSGGGGERRLRRASG